MRIAINGFGRIGRTFLRCLLKDKVTWDTIQVVALNIGNSEKEKTAHMFMYDTLMGIYGGSVHMEDDYLVVDGHKIQIIAELDVQKLPWKKLQIDWVVDCTGKFTDGDKARQHIQSGAQRVLISAPAYNEDSALIPGVNEELFDTKKHFIVSMGSCTTNAFMTTLKVLHDTFGIERGCMTTTHAYTNSQVLLDVEAKDLRFSRAAALNIIPAGTGASQMIEKIIPDLKGKISAMAIRVPVGKVSLIDLVFEARTDLTAQTINDAFMNSSQGRMKNILAITDQPLVSSDFSGNDNSVIIDSLLTHANGSLGQVFGWYDNEWGYSMRMRDLLVYIAQH